MNLIKANEMASETKETLIVICASSVQTQLKPINTDYPVV